MMNCRRLVIAAIVTVWGLPADASEPLVFEPHTVATGLTRGYQAVVADLNRDGRPDIVALSSGLPDLVWFENPQWERHVITSGLERMINMAAHDVDGDGVPELALTHGFSTTYAESPGVISILTHQGDPRQPWTTTEIDRVPTTHRLRWADVEGNGSKVLVNAPLIGPLSSSPDYEDTLSLVWYHPDDWRRQTITTLERGVVHGIGIAPWSVGDRDAVLSASFLGVHLHEFADGRWSRMRLSEGDPAAWPKSGASEVQVGHAGGDRFFATIEPWHGHQVVVYRSSGRSEAWIRTPIDTTIEDGHTLVTADLDGDGDDEIIAGERRGRQSVYLYRADPDTGEWSRQIVDDGDMAAASCVVADLNQDDKLDVVCIGTATANLKWYEQAR